MTDQNITSETPAGFIDTVAGTVTVTRTDGTTVTLNDGDPIYQGDTVATGTGGELAITFVDQSTLALGERGRMTIDEMIYDPDDQSGEALLNVAEGVFVYASGMIAKTDPDAMAIATPHSTIGIRGTKIVGRADPDGGESTVTLLEEDDGFVGEIVVTTAGGTQVLNQVNQTTSMGLTEAAPTPPQVLAMDSIRELYGARRDLVPAHRQPRRDETPPAETETPVDAIDSPLAPHDDAAGQAAPEQVLDQAIPPMPADAAAELAPLSDAPVAPPKDTAAAADEEADTETPWTDEMIAAWHVQQQDAFDVLDHHGMRHPMPHAADMPAMPMPFKPEEFAGGRDFQDDHVLAHTTGLTSPDGDADWNTSPVADTVSGDGTVAPSFDLPQAEATWVHTKWVDRVSDGMLDIYRHAHSGEMTADEAQVAMQWLNAVAQHDADLGRLAENLYPRLETVIHDTRHAALTAGPDVYVGDMESGIALLHDIMDEQPHMPDLAPPEPAAPATMLAAVHRHEADPMAEIHVDAVDPDPSSYTSHAGHIDGSVQSVEI